MARENSILLGAYNHLLTYSVKQDTDYLGVAVSSLTKLVNDQFTNVTSCSEMIT